MDRLKKICIRTAVAVVLGYLAVCAGCAGIQRRLIYFPPVFTPEAAEQAAKTSGMERWRTAEGKAIGWKRLSPSWPSDGQVLITYGNGSCAAGCSHYADVLQQIAPLDVFVLEYPGYGDRPGKPTEQSLFAAADEACKLLLPGGRLYLIGESLGTGVAAYLAGKYPAQIAGVALLAPYNRLTDVAQEHMPWLPVHLMLMDRYPSEDYLRDYTGPLAVLVAGKDRVVPEKFGRRLYNGYAGPRKLWEFPTGDHGTVMVQPVEVWRQIFSFWTHRQDMAGKSG